MWLGSMPFRARSKAMLAARCEANSISPGVKPSVALTKSLIFTSCVSSRARIFVHSAWRASSSGGPIGITRSNRPGRNTAGSMLSTKFVAQTRRCPARVRNAGIILSNSLTTPRVPGLSVRAVAISSTSSMNTTMFSSLSSSVRALRSSAASEFSPLSSFEGNNSTNGQPSRPAIARAKVVLPVPGGPNSITADGAFTPILAANSESARGAMIRFSIKVFSASMPATRSHNAASQSSPPH